VLREGCRCPVETDQAHNAWEAQYIEPVSQRNPDKNISRKERQLNQLATVFPTVDGFV
jgi:hypothetical protein